MLQNTRVTTVSELLMGTQQGAKLPPLTQIRVKESFKEGFWTPKFATNDSLIKQHNSSFYRSCTNTIPDEKQDNHVNLTMNMSFLRITS